MAGDHRASIQIARFKDPTPVVTITVATWLHGDFGWVMLPLDVGPLQLRMMLNTGYPSSVISEAARTALIENELVPPQDLTAYTLTHLTLAGQQLPDLPVRVRGVSLVRARVDGMLGLDFLKQFSVIHFDTEALRLTLTLP